MAVPRLWLPVAAIYLASTHIAFAQTSSTPIVPADVKSVPHGYGWSFTDNRGWTLYTSERDARKPGGSTCNDACAQTWPPLIAPTGAEPLGEWSFVKRDDGMLQWAFRGQPVYTYSNDPLPGVAYGDGFGQVWRVARENIDVPMGLGIGLTELGHTLTDARGLTLYTSGHDSSCRKKCLDTWMPVEAPAIARASGPWSIIDREDGLRQWAFKDRPLYRYVGDVLPREYHGHGRDGWSAAVLEPALPMPKWLTIQGSDAGELYADREGRTLYTHTPRAKAPCKLPNCLPEEWEPLRAAPDSQAVGVWSLVPLSGDERQWAFKGSRVYTNRRDRKPGEFKGIRYGGDRAFAAIMRSGELMPGVKGDGDSFLQ